MNINCLICRDLFGPSHEIYSTRCGHLFHVSCLMQWFERSKTCPQCREKSNEKLVHRIYLNLENTEQITDDIGTLREKLDNMQYEMKLTQKDTEIYQEKYNKSKEKFKKLKEYVSEIEEKSRSTNSVMLHLKDQVKFFKSRVQESDKLSEEITKLKSDLQMYDHIQIAVNGTREAVQEILKNETHMESLATLVAILKKSLLDVERSNRDLDNRLRHSQNDLAKFKRESRLLESSNKELIVNLSQSRKAFDDEKKYLKGKIEELANPKNGEIVASNNTSVDRIFTESPAPLRTGRRILNRSSIIDLTPDHSPSLNEKIKLIKDSDSPYLTLKPSSVEMDHPTFFNTKFIRKQPFQKQSIFKQPVTTDDKFKIPKLSPIVSSDGLGGHCKVEKYPEPNANQQAGIKRNKSTSSLMPSKKFRKLAPATGNKKMTDYLGNTN